MTDRSGQLGRTYLTHALRSAGRWMRAAGELVRWEKWTWPAATIEPGAVFEGNVGAIVLGQGTVIEAGALLSTAHGGTITLGRRCIIRRGAMLVTFGGDVLLGESCGVNPYSILYGHGGLRVGDHVRFGAHCVVVPANHTFGSLLIPICDQPVVAKGIDIGSDVWIGAAVTILDGVRIGNGAVVGAGAVVTSDLAPLSINAGVPARPIGRRG